MPEPVGIGGGGGGADLNLVFQIAGLGDVEKKYEDLVQEISQSKKEMETAEVRAAEIFREQAERAAGEMQDASEVVSGSKQKSELQERILMKIFQDYSKMGKQIQELESALKGLAGVYAEEDEEEEKKPKKKTTADMAHKVGKFLNVFEQSKSLIGRGLSSLSPTTLGATGLFGLMFYGLSQDDKLSTLKEQYTQLWDSTIQSTNAA